MPKLNNQIVIDVAKQVGFHLVGFSKYQNFSHDKKNLTEWISKGYNAGMKYMEEKLDEKCDAALVFPKVKGIISLGLNYYQKEKHSNKEGYGKVSKYAWGEDYHYVMWKMLDKLEKALKELDPEFECKYNVDTGPIRDKVWAILSGLGWEGKNSNIISKEYGSWIFLATVLTNREFEGTTPHTDHCGKCTKCIDFCPTGAIKEGKIIDANRCISYLTIENKQDIDSSFQGKLNDWIFGCDICQEVCPWNKKYQKETDIPEFKIETNKEISLEEVFDLTNSKFNKKFFTSAITRTRAKGLKRNAKFLLEDKNKIEEKF